MVFIRYAFTVTATGKHVAMNMHHYWKFRDGKICYVRSSEDTAQPARYGCSTAATTRISPNGPDDRYRYSGLWKSKRHPASHSERWLP
jgi:hypothetical protein